MAGSMDDIVMSDKEEDFSEAICAICDNGGDVICCEGKCLRAFHATAKAGSDAACDSLGFSKKQIKEIETFKCENCIYNQHQCYICGKLGSSDISAGAEVFQCDTRTCGYFYHPSCVANALQFKCEDEPKNIEAEIASGKTFTCPLHFCYACKETELEDEADLPMQFAVCRRCPRAYHRKCLPGTITFQADADKGIQQRAWDELIPNKVLIYCMEHPIDVELLTPLRCHIIFPHCYMKKEKQAVESDSEVKAASHPLKGFKKKTHSKLLQRTDKSSKVKQLNKPSSAWEKKISGPYSPRGRKLLKKNRTSSKKALYELKMEANTLENNSSSGKDLNAPLSNEDSDAIKLENRMSSGSGKRSKTYKGVEGNKDSVATTNVKNWESSNEVLSNEKSKEIKLENGESCSSKKPSRSSNEVLCNENPKEIKLENRESCSSSKKQCRSSIGEAEAENNTAAPKKSIRNGHAEPADNSMNSSDMHKSGSRSKTGYMSLGFAPGPCRPFSEYSSAGWLDE